MLKVGDKVSLFHDMGKVGRIRKILSENKINYWSTGGTTTSKKIAEINWEDGTFSSHNIEDVMRLE